MRIRILISVSMSIFACVVQRFIFKTADHRNVVCSGIQLCAPGCKDGLESMLISSLSGFVGRWKVARQTEVLYSEDGGT